MKNKTFFIGLVIFLLTFQMVYADTEEIPDNLEVVNEVIQEEDIKLTLIKDNYTLRSGNAGEDTFLLQSFLKAKGFNIVPDYKYGPATVNALKEYQTRNGLTSDGIAGQQTLKLINQDIEDNKIILSSTSLSFTKEVPKNKWIIINKGSNMLYHMNNDKVIKAYSVATGKTPGLTPEGKYSIAVKFVNPSWGGGGTGRPIKGGASNNPLGKRWLGLNIRGGGRYGIHGNSSPNSIGTYASAGCIRMHNYEVEALFDIVDIGTEVWIGSEAKLSELGIVFFTK